MKIITTKAHGILDYLMGALLIIAPWIFDFARDGAETWIPVVLGVGTVSYSLLTKYEYSIFKSIPMKTHLNLDLLSGIFLAASPWVFGFNDYVYLSHLVLGIVGILASLLTETHSRYSEKGTPGYGHAAHTNLP